MSEELFDLESVYDSEIAPLMAKVIKICKKHKLPMFATFMYASTDDGYDFCTTNLPFDERPRSPQFDALEPTIRGSNTFAFRMRVTKNDGSIEETVILP